MNRILFTLLFSSAIVSAIGQTFQGTIKPGSTSNSVILAIKPSANYSDKPSNLQFTIAVPQSVGARPTMTITTNNYSTLFTTTATFSNATYGTDYIYLINMITPTLTTTKNYVANTEDVVAEVSFTPNAGTIANIKLMQLPGGNATGAGTENSQYNFYTEFASGGDKTNQTAMFYTTTGGTVVNNPLGYNGLSSVSAGSGVVPVKWLSFNVQKQNSNALLKWEVANQDNSDYFEIEAGTDANKLATIGKVTSTAATSYSFVHHNYINLQGRYVYYRIKQVDKDGRLSYTNVLKLNVDSKAFAFDVIGNPVIGNDLNIAIQSFGARQGSLTILDLHGKKVMQQNISWPAGSSQQLLTLPAIAKGLYSAILQLDDEQYSVKFVK